MSVIQSDWPFFKRTDYIWFFIWLKIKQISKWPTTFGQICENDWSKKFFAASLLHHCIIIRGCLKISVVSCMNFMFIFFSYQTIQQLYGISVSLRQQGDVFKLKWQTAAAPTYNFPIRFVTHHVSSNKYFFFTKPLLLLFAPINLPD